MPAPLRTKQAFTWLIASLISLSALNLQAATGKDVIYRLDGNAYEGYYIAAQSQVTDTPLILMIHDWDGLTDYEKKRAQMLSKQGYSVFAADLFGQGIRPTEVKDKRQHTGELYKDRAKMRALMQAALKAARQQGGNLNNAVAMGYCFGGAAVLELARSGADMKGFATFHGGLKTPQGQDYSNAKSKILVMHGSADSAIPMAQFAQLTNELEAANVEHEMITYSGAPHAFTVFDSGRYHESADKQSWKRFSDFLKDVSNP